MKPQNLIFLLISLFLMVGCGGATGDEPTAEQLANQPALVTVAPSPTATMAADMPKEESENVPAGNQPAAETSPILISPTATSVITTSSEAVIQVVTPVTIDLSQLTPQPPTNSTPSVAPAPGVPNPQVAMEQKVKMDLAQKLNLDISQITVVNSEAVDWNDSSLGCPQPGFGYMDVITPGYKITLSANGQQYIYHTDTNNAFILCDPS